MRKPVVIRTQFPTVEETARIMKVSKADVKWLTALADRLISNRAASSSGSRDDETHARNETIQGGKPRSTKNGRK
jgi:hypothetical protein